MPMTLRCHPASGLVRRAARWSSPCAMLDRWWLLGRPPSRATTPSDDEQSTRTNHDLRTAAPSAVAVRRQGQGRDRHRRVRRVRRAAARSRSARSAASCVLASGTQGRARRGRGRGARGRRRGRDHRAAAGHARRRQGDARRRAQALRPRRSARRRLRHEQAGLHPRARLRGLAGGDGRQCARHLVHGQGGRHATGSPTRCAARCW